MSENKVCVACGETRPYPMYHGLCVSCYRADVESVLTRLLILEKIWRDKGEPMATSIVAVNDVLAAVSASRVCHRIASDNRQAEGCNRQEAKP